VNANERPIQKTGYPLLDRFVSKLQWPNPDPTNESEMLGKLEK
jgi:hypothetical protein